MSVRGWAKHRMRERGRHHVYLNGDKLRRGCRVYFQATLDGRVMLDGWFIADGPDPVCHIR